ncbi:LOW QUALITY PROTEIN: hypothetical protein ACHAW6_008125 [Cyclotella cf. meneghiniana]
MNYFDSMTWFAIRIIIIIASLFTLALLQVDFIQAYPQALIETDIPHLMLLANLHGQKQAGRVWNSYLIKKLWSIGFQQSLIAE